MAVGATCCWIGSAAAQNQGAGQPPAGMVEIYGCNFNDGSGMEDLLAVTARWNRWADDRGVTDYTAAIMTPVLHSDEMTADVLWVGANSSGGEFGAGLGQWLTEGADLNAEFGEVVDCSSHSLFAEVVFREPQGPPPENGVASFQDCTINPGRNIGETLAASGRWANYVGENGPDIFMAELFPFAGLTGDADYTYKAVAGFPSADAYGEFLDMMTGNGFAGANAANGIIGPYVSCNSSRLYALNFVRIAGE